jgi:tetratricopeptide (TPR) repeat protein
MPLLKNILLLVCLLVSCSVFGQSSSSKQAVIKKKLDEADSYQISNRIDSRTTALKAYTLYKEVIALDPLNVEGYLGIAHTNQYYIPEVTNDTIMKYLNKAIKIEPENMMGYNYRGDVFSRKKEYPLAILDYKKAIELYPKAKGSDIPNSIGDCYLNLKQFKEAIEWFTVTLNNTDNTDCCLRDHAYEMRAMCKYWTGDKEGACMDVKNCTAYSGCAEFEKMMEKIRAKQK